MIQKVKKILNQIQRRLYCAWRKIIVEHIDFRRFRSNSIVIQRFMCNFNIKFHEENESIGKFVVNYYLDHRFDLLGSGWARNYVGALVEGFEGKKYEINDMSYNSSVEFVLQDQLSSHRRTTSQLLSYIQPGYQLIDWQRDIKSGFRWSTKTYCREALKTIGNVIGSDIKIPWELGRLQHLPLLAIIGISQVDLQNVLIHEFKNQVYDFIGSNPIEMGVNWSGPMDVAIRSINLLIAFDLFRQYPNKEFFSKSFEETISNSIFQHGRFLINNLENMGRVSTNHYLSNLAGLIFISSYLFERKDTITWLDFSINEFFKQFKLQFYEDGGNFESSTFYHRLSSEIIILSTALILRIINDKRIRNKLSDLTLSNFNLRNEKFELPKWYTMRLFRAGTFICNLTKPNGNLVQFGDNDSGRIIKISLTGKFIRLKKAIEKYDNLNADQNHYSISNIVNGSDLYWDENQLHSGSVIGYFSGLFNYWQFNKMSAKYQNERHLIKVLSNNHEIIVPHDTTLQSKNSFIKVCTPLPFFKRTKIKASSQDNQSFTNGLLIFEYPESGLYIFKSNNLFLAINGSPVGQHDKGGHTHNDKLSFELSINGNDLVLDPGTYVYHPSVEKRNLFRSTAYHSTVIHGVNEQNDFIANSLFSLKPESKVFLLEKKSNSLSLLLKYKYVIHKRIFTILKNQVLIEDFSNTEFNLSLNPFEFYSNGYGKIFRKENLKYAL